MLYSFYNDRLRHNGYEKRNRCATPDTKKPLKNHSLDVAKKSVGTYSSSYAVAPDLAEEVNRVDHKICDINLKEVNVGLTDVK